ncbi:hypothetical protein B296_00053063, partial [Ensete ventricosum]
LGDEIYTCGDCNSMFPLDLEMRSTLVGTVTACFSVWLCQVEVAGVAEASLKRAAMDAEGWHPALAGQPSRQALLLAAIALRQSKETSMPWHIQDPRTR